MFQLQRHFSLTSLIAFLVVLVGLDYFYTMAATNSLVESAENSNVTITQIFSNIHWGAYAGFAKQAPTLTSAQIRTHPATIALHNAIKNHTVNTPVVKVKVYSVDGLTIFSTEEEQIGEDERDSVDIITARNGGVSSALIHRDTFKAFGYTISDLDLIATYIPIQRSADAPIEGIFEVYSEVTPLLNVMKETRLTIVAGVGGMLSILYFVLLIIVRHADKILQRQRQELLTTQADLQTERTQLAEKVAAQTADLRQMNTDLIHAAHLKDRFLAMTSHELRTPLTTILGRSETLLGRVYGTLTAKQRSVVVGIQTGGHHLLELVNDLLDVSKVAMNDISVEKSAVSLAQVCDAAIATVQPKIAEKQLRFTVTMDDSIGEIEADQRRLRQILINLLDNAIKFTPAGAAIGLDVQGDVAEQLVRLIIWDEGIGIPEGLEERIFDPFVQVDSRLSRSYEGAGLGLALVSHLTEKHGGSVRVESSADVGSRFIVTLPWQPSSESPHVNQEILQFHPFSPTLA